MGCQNLPNCIVANNYFAVFSFPSGAFNLSYPTSAQYSSKDLAEPEEENGKCSVTAW